MLPFHTNMRKKILHLLLTAALTASFLTAPAQNSAASVSGSERTTSDITAVDGDPEADRHINQQEASENTMGNFSKRSLKASSQSANPYTGINYTHSDAFDGKNIYNGIDVSKYQPTVDWDKVKADGIDFVFVRVGYRGYGAAGTLAADICFEKHVEGALAAGLQVGLYYYTEAISSVLY